MSLEGKRTEEAIKCACRKWKVRREEMLLLIRNGCVEVVEGSRGGKRVKVAHGLLMTEARAASQAIEGTKRVPFEVRSPIELTAEFGEIDRNANFAVMYGGRKR